MPSLSSTLTFQPVAAADRAADAKLAAVGRSLDGLKRDAVQNPKGAAR